ncbi:MAG: outer membrane beta-barrel protein [Legionella sp.]
MRSNNQNYIKTLAKACFILSVGLFNQTATADGLGEVDTIGFNDGIYGGAMIGGTFAHANWMGASALTAYSPNTNIDIITEVWPLAGSQTLSNFAGRVFLGYQLVRSDLYLGAEVGGTFSNSFQFQHNDALNFTLSGPFIFDPEEVEGIIHATAANETVAILGNSEFNIDLKPGYLFTPNALLFAKLGVSFNNMKIADVGTWTSSAETCSDLGGCSGPSLGAVVARGNSSNEQNITGIRIGIGGEYLFTHHLGLILDYTYTRYGSISTLSQGVNMDAFQVEAFGEDSPVVSFSSQNVMVGLNLHY